MPAGQLLLSKAAVYTKVRNPEIPDEIQVGDKVTTTLTRALLVDIAPNPAG